MYVTKANTAVTLAQFLLFCQNKISGLKELKIIASMGMFRAAAKQTVFLNICFQNLVQSFYKL